MEDSNLIYVIGMILLGVLFLIQVARASRLNRDLIDTDNDLIFQECLNSDLADEVERVHELNANKRREIELLKYQLDMAHEKIEKLKNTEVKSDAG